MTPNIFQAPEEFTHGVAVEPCGLCGTPPHAMIDAQLLTDRGWWLCPACGALGDRCEEGLQGCDEEHLVALRRRVVRESAVRWNEKQKAIVERCNVCNNTGLSYYDVCCTCARGRALREKRRAEFLAAQDREAAGGRS